jgi:hypothetical protein
MSNLFGEYLHAMNYYSRDLAWDMWESRCVAAVKCDLCNGIESPWHVIGECPGAKAVGIRTAWADRMYVET